MQIYSGTKIILTINPIYSLSRMKLKAFSLFFLITFFAQAQFSLSGRVLSTETGAPVPNAEVWNKTTGKLTKAAENGNFEVMDLEEGTYEFAVFGYDYE